MTPDQINSIFPFVGCLFVYLNIRSLYRDKTVKGINLVSPMFFYAGQLYGVYFLYTLNQWYSLVAAAALVSFFLVWYAMALWYRWKEFNEFLRW